MPKKEISTFVSYQKSKINQLLLLTTWRSTLILNSTVPLIALINIREGKKYSRKIPIWGKITLLKLLQAPVLSKLKSDREYLATPLIGQKVEAQEEFLQIQWLQKRNQGPL